MALVVAAFVPIAVLIGIGLWLQWRADEAQATQSALIEARVVASQVDDELGNFTSLLAGLSAAVSTNPADTLTNDAVLRRVKAELPDYVAAVATGDARLAGKRLGRLLAAGVGEGTILFSLSNLVGGALGGWRRFHSASESLRRRRGAGDLLRALDAVYRAEAAWKGGRADIVALLEQATRDVCGAAKG